MMQLIPKWRVQVTIGNPTREIVVMISERHIENVLRSVAAIQWSENALEAPQSITVSIERTNE